MDVSHKCALLYKITPAEREKEIAERKRKQNCKKKLKKERKKERMKEKNCRKKEIAQR